MRGRYEKGMTGVTWHDLTPPVPHAYDPGTSPHCATLSGHVHCARGPKRCATCRAFAGAKQWLLFAVDYEYDGKEARPTMLFLVGGETIKYPYNVIGSFADEPSARAFASAHVGVVQFVPAESGAEQQGS